MQEQKKLFPLYIIIFIGYFGYALTIALFVPMLLDTKFSLLPALTSTAQRVTLSGFLLAMYPLGQFLGSPIIGKLSDHYGRKKVLLISMFICVIGFASIGLSIHFLLLHLLFISCFITGLCESNMTIAQAVISKLATNTVQKTKLIGYAYSACSLGYITGPIVGGLGGSTHSYAFPFWLTALAIAPLVLWIKYKFIDEHVIDVNSRINFFAAITSMKTIFNNKKLRKFYFLNFCIFFAIQGLYRMAPVFIQNKWQPSLHIFTSVISFVSLMCLIANMFLLGFLAKRFKTKNLLLSLLIFSAVFTISIIIPKQFHWIWLTYGLAALPTVMALSTSTTWLSNQAAQDIQGQVLGNNQALLVLAEAVSAAIGGVIGAFDINLALLVMAGILVFSFIFTAFVRG